MSNYEQDYSHTHCYTGQEGHEKHLACCICRKQNPNNTEEWRVRFMHRFSLALQGATNSPWMGDKIADFIAKERTIAVKEVVENIIGKLPYQECFKDEVMCDRCQTIEEIADIVRSFIPKDEGITH